MLRCLLLLLPHADTALLFPMHAALHRSSVLTLINSAVGAGVLSFPFALRAMGWAAGLACIALIAATEAFTLFVLSRFAEHTGARSYPALVRPARAPAARCQPSSVLCAPSCGMQRRPPARPPPAVLAAPLGACCTAEGPVALHACFAV